MKISELVKPPFQNDGDIPLLIRYADALPVIKKPKTSHHSEERRKRWEELNAILIQAEIDAAEKSGEKNLACSSLNWSLIATVYDHIIHDYSQTVKEVPQATMELLHNYLVILTRRLGSLIPGRNLKRLFFISPILVYVSDLFGPEDSIQIVVEEDLNGVNKLFQSLLCQSSYGPVNFRSSLNVSRNAGALNWRLQESVQMISAAPSKSKTSNYAFISQGKLKYKAYTAKGDKFPDFSRVGYQNSETHIPFIRKSLLINPSGADDTLLIQNAIDKIAKMPVVNGFRGALILAAGEFKVNGTITISDSGIVLRGAKNAVIRATGTTQRTLIEVDPAKGQPRWTRELKNSVDVNAAYVPVGATVIPVTSVVGFKVGDQVVVVRHSNWDWINLLEQKQNGWKPFELSFERVITSIDATRKTITIDTGITVAIDSRWGGGHVAGMVSNRLENIGIENLSLVSDYDDSVKCMYRKKYQYNCDMKHGYYGIRMGSVEHGWIRNVNIQYFMSGFLMDIASKFVTITDCAVLQPVSEIIGGYRYAYDNRGQRNLVMSSTSSTGRHSFVTGPWIPGPSVFYNVSSEKQFSDEGSHQRFANGILWDNVNCNGGQLKIQNRGDLGTGQGWSGANHVIWNSVGSIVVQSPPTAVNFAIGVVGSKGKAAVPDAPDGIWESPGARVEPQSLFMQQLTDRLGSKAQDNIINAL